MQLAQSSRQSGSCCLLIVQTESRGSENEKQRHAKPKQQLCDNSCTSRALYLCSPGPFPGGTLWDCPGGQLGAITTSTYLIRGLQTVRSGDMLPASLAQGSPEESHLPNGRAMGAPPRSFNLDVETRCPCPSPRGSDVVATWTWGFAKVPTLLLGNKSSQNSVASDRNNHFRLISLRVSLDENRGGGAWLYSSVSERLTRPLLKA